MTSGPLRVVVADDQELVRTGFCVILEAAGFTVESVGFDGSIYGAYTCVKA